MLHFGLGLGLLCKLFDDLGICKKSAEYSEKEHFIRLYETRREQMVLPCWILQVKIAMDANKKVSYTNAIRYLQNKD